ncbi:MAG: helix-turn-helix domain-containing protein [Chloroflexota bacterium]|nr:helix-turn-helix domain-containing protein [Chloroflexota bacterium]
MADRQEQWMTVEQVAAFLSLKEETVRRWIRSGEIPVLDLPSRRAGYRIRRSDLDRFIAKRYGPVEKAAA